MTSLCPGPLFMSPGLNQHSTPTPPSDIDSKLQRQPFNGRDWPRDSPVARVYDIRNTSTSLVLLNKRRKKKSQLRGLTERSGEIVVPDPERHIPEEPTVNWYHHKKCLNSSTQLYRPTVHLDLGWVNATHRPPVKFDSGSHVNHRRHTSCRVSGDAPLVGWSGTPRRPHTGMSYGTGSEMRSLTPMLNDPDLSEGGRKYLYSIARIYSTSQMKKLKQDQYHQLLFKELAKGYHSPKEYDRYFSYLNTPRKTQFGKLDNYEEVRRSMSAPPPPSNNDISSRGGENERTPSSKQKRVPPFSSRSWAPSMISTNSRMSSASSRLPLNRQKGSKKKSTTKHKQSAPSSKKPTREAEPEEPQEPEPASTVSVSDEDQADHTRKEESEAPEEHLISIRESDEMSHRSRERTSESETVSPRKAEEPPQKAPSPSRDEDGVSPRKGNDGSSPREDDLSPRKGDEDGSPRMEDETPRKEDETDAKMSEGKDERSSEGAAGTNAAASSSNTTSNNFLALIVSDAEKDDEVKMTEDSERGQQEMEEDALPRDFNDTNLASGRSPRINREGRTRPLSRAGRSSEFRDRENSDDDYDDTDEETENMASDKDKSQQAEPVQRSVQPEQPIVDSSRTDDSKTEERGEMEEEATTILDLDKRASSPEAEDGKHERAEDDHQADPQRSLLIPVKASTESSQKQSQKGEVVDLSAEDRNKDVEKIEY